MAVERRRWVCPQCGKGWQIPADAEDPERCPKCESEPAGLMVAIQELPKPAPYRKSHRRVPQITMIILAGTGITAAACLLLSSVKPNLAKQFDPEFAAVDAYLKSHLNDPSYEVVRWWSCSEQAATAKKQIDKLKQDALVLAAEIESHQKIVDAAKKQGAPRSEWDRREVEIGILQIKLEGIQDKISFKLANMEDLCRLKFRTKNEFGASVIKTVTFVIHKGNAREVENIYGSFELE